MTAELTERLDRLPLVTAAFDAQSVAIDVGGGVPTLVLDLDALRVADPLTTPWGAPAVRIVSQPADTAAPVVVIVLEGDVAFAPDPVAGQRRVLPDSLGHLVTDLPSVVGFHEMADVLAAGSQPNPNLDRVLGATLAAAACVEGARTVGLDVAALDAGLELLIERVRSL